MSNDHNHDGVKYEFKHDTDNLTIFSGLIFSIAGVTLVLALVLVWMRDKRDSMAEEDAQKTSPKLLELRAHEKAGLGGKIKGFEGMNIGEAMKEVVGDYSK